MSIHATNIYAPNETSLLGIKQSELAAESAAIGIELDIKGTDPAVKDYFAPLLPWEICAVQAQTSNGKTMFSNFWVRQIAEQLKRQNRDEVILYVSLEESIEAMAFAEFGRILEVRPADIARGNFKDRQKLLMAKSEIDGVPIWRIAESAQTPEDAPELTLSNIYRAIQELVKGNVTGEKWKPAVVVVDYLQVLPIDPEVKQASRQDQRRLQVARDVERLRKMTTHLQCPIIVPLQAKQELSSENPPYKIPSSYDGMETSAIATRFDRIISLWMPKTSYVVGETVWNKEKTRSLSVREDQVLLKVNKQRGGLPAGMTWEMRVDFQKGEYYDAFYKKK
jgi:replicative DNA helicase